MFFITIMKNVLLWKVFHDFFGLEPQKPQKGSKNYLTFCFTNLGMCVLIGTWLRSQQLGLESRHPVKYSIVNKVFKKKQERWDVWDPGNKKSLKKTCTCTYKKI